ncbi:hypothetical protein CARUB_v10012608mg, partial [Capsella rubella]
PLSLASRTRRYKGFRMREVKAHPKELKLVGAHCHLGSTITKLVSSYNGFWLREVKAHPKVLKVVGAHCHLSSTITKEPILVHTDLYSRMQWSMKLFLFVQQVSNGVTLYDGPRESTILNIPEACRAHTGCIVIEDPQVAELFLHQVDRTRRYKSFRRREVKAHPKELKLVGAHYHLGSTITKLVTGTRPQSLVLRTRSYNGFWLREVKAHPKVLKLVGAHYHLSSTITKVTLIVVVIFRDATVLWWKTLIKSNS